MCDRHAAYAIATYLDQGLVRRAMRLAPKQGTDPGGARIFAGLPAGGFHPL